MEDTKENELEQLKARVTQLEQELREPPTHWQAKEFYWAYYANAGFVLGMLAAITSLLFNVIGSTLVQQHPLRLIQVYLTFPLGEKALELNGGITLTLGCCLYLATGMLLGVPFYLLLVYFTKGKSLGYRFVFATGLAVSMWLVHFYAILSWLQPVLFGGNWIVAEIPIWVGALTHLVYGWTMVLVYPLGRYTPYRRQTDAPVESDALEAH